MANASEPAVILLVDHDEHSRSSEASVLRAAGYEVRDAGTGEQALALLDAGVPDLAILAPPLPDMDVQLLRQRLAPGADAGELPVLLITGESSGGGGPAPAPQPDAEPSLPRPVSAPALLAVAQALIQSGRRWRGVVEGRREVELRYRAMFDAMQEGFALHEIICDERGTPVDYRFLEVNPAFERLTNFRRDEIVGKRVCEVIPTVEHYWIEQYGRVALTGEPAHLEHRSVRLGRWFEAFAYCTRPGQFAAIFTDITARKQAALEHELTAQLLETLNESTRPHDLLDAVAGFFKHGSGCAAVGIRVREADDFPYVATRGFAEGFVETENLLRTCPLGSSTERDAEGHPRLDCLCGRVVQGRVDASLPFFTAHGSFWTNSTSELFADPAATAHLGYTRNRCNQEGYESVALIPLHHGSERIGLLQLADRQRNMFTPDSIGLWERLADHVAVALAKLRAEEQVREANERLEQRVAERTAALETANRALQAEVAERMRAEAAVAAERRRFNEVLEALPVYVVLLAADYRVPFANRFFRERFGDSRGARCHEYLFGRDEPCENCESFVAMRTRKPHRWEWHGPDGRYYDINDYPFTDSDGSPLVLEVGLDITEQKAAEQELRRHRDHLEQLVRDRTSDLERKNEELASEIAERARAERQLRESRESLNRAQSVANIGSWRLQVASNELEWSDEVYRMFGVVRGTELTYEAFLASVHPEDRAEVDRRWQAALRGAPYQVEHRIVIAGQTKWVREQAELELEPDGTLRGGFGTVQDITARKTAELALERQARLLDAIVENTRAHLAYLDPDMRFVWVNSSYAASTGHSKAQLIGRLHFELFPDEDNERVFQRVRDSGIVAQYLEKPFEFADQPERGTTYWDWTLTPVKDERAQVEGLVLSLMNVTEQVRQRERLLAAERARVDIAEHLNDEIAHRVKNNLAVVSGLLEVQALSAGEADFATGTALREAVARIRTFAHIHERMYASRSESVDLRDILGQICAATKEIFAARRAVDISVDAESFSCHARVATNLSVIANELVTNALKHGAPGASGAMEVKVQLRVDDERLTLAVWNGGNPVPASFEVRGHRSMGLRLVSDMVTVQFQGTFALRPDHGGTLAEVVLPRDRLSVGGPGA